MCGVSIEQFQFIVTNNAIGVTCNYDRFLSTCIIKNRFNIMTCPSCNIKTFCILLHNKELSTHPSLVERGSIAAWNTSRPDLCAVILDLAIAWMHRHRQWYLNLMIAHHWHRGLLKQPHWYDGLYNVEAPQSTQSLWTVLIDMQWAVVCLRVRAYSICLSVYIRCWLSILFGVGLFPPHSCTSLIWELMCSFMC